MMAYRMYALAPVERGGRRDWTLDDLDALGEEIQPSKLTEHLDSDFYAPSRQLLQALALKPDQLPECVKALPRLKDRNWYLTKQVYTFRPEEMEDLEFQEATPVLAAALPNPEGRAAASLLTVFGKNAVPILIAACQTTNLAQRINASSVLAALKDPRVSELLLTLFKDDSPKVRYNAVMAASGNWDARFVEPLLGMFRDSNPMIRRQAAQWLASNEPAGQAPMYVGLLADSDPNVQGCALQVLSRINREMIPRDSLVRLLGSPQIETVSLALNLLENPRPSAGWEFQPLPGVPRPQPRQEQLFSFEAAPLTTNRLTLARLMGLKVLRNNADAQAIELTLPLLRDTNSLVRTRAVSLLQSVSGQAIPNDDPNQWEQWWAVNKATFTPHKQVR
jgi:HEAT repeat protein